MLFITGITGLTLKSPRHVVLQRTAPAKQNLLPSCLRHIIVATV